jgi:hypothetical protein
MENEFLIFDYIDGKLSPQQEEAFFNLLSQNEELRTEFKQQLALKTAFTKDLHTFVPSPETTMNLFSKMGIGAGVGAATSTLVNTTPSLFSKIVTFIGSTAFKSVAVTLLTAGITFFGLLKYEVIEWYDEEGNTTQNLTVNKVNETPKPQEINANNNLNGGVSSDDQEQQIKIVEKIVDRNKFIFTFDTLKLSGNEKIKAIEFFNSLKNENTQSDIVENNLIEIDNASINPFKPNFSFNPNFNINNERYNSPILNLSNFNIDLPISVEYTNALQKSMLSNNNDININRDYSGLLNSRIGLFYNHNSQFQFGVEYRSEDFFQEFSIIDGSGRLLTYYQQPEFNVVSGVFRYLPNFSKFNISFLEFEPFVLASYGADLSGGGIVARAGVGLNCYVTDNLYVQALYDYSNLNFKQGDMNYNSRKTGLNLGIGWNFNK